MEACEKIISFARERYATSDYAALATQYEQWRQHKPLAGLKILDATPLFANTLLKYRNLIAAGADLTIGLSPFISHNDKILHFATHDLKIRATSDQGSFDVVLDCAGAFSGSEARIGYVELTRSGIEYYTNCQKPVYLADSSRIKEIETEFGTGESLFRALEYLGFKDFIGKKLVVFGSGKVGRGIRREALIRGCLVCVVSDPLSIANGEKYDVVDYRNKELVHKAIGDAWAVVMATGIKGALSSTIDAKRVAESSAILINMGAEDEFGESFEPERLLQGGRTLNFILDEPTHLRFIDPTMVLHNYGAQFLTENPNAKGIITPNSVIEENILETTKLGLDTIR